MRVISQNGTLDVPYEQVIISRYRTSIFFINKSFTNKKMIADDTELAVYSTEEKARKAMEDLQYAYACRNIAMFDKEKAIYIPNDKMTKAVIGGVFQFPTEEELE